ncbi:DNA-binding protein [Polaribacter ponticola]|uniref:DNA-binding protein n=1 Tax=Polaribacter ponticola TaxID=2978475 RepID=UPI00308235AC
MNIIKLYERLERIERLLLFKKKVLNIEEASEVTGYKISYLYKLTSLKEIPHSKPNKGSIFLKKKS